MTEDELLALLKAHEGNALDSEFMAQNKKLHEEYLGRPYGDEEAGKSSYVSRDIEDLVEADMPSLARVFLSTNEIMEFEPLSDEEEAEAEAEQKTHYINWLVRNQDKNSFKVIFDWLKAAEIEKLGVVKFYCRTEQEVEEKRYHGLDPIELAQIQKDLEDEKGVESVNVIESEGAITFRIARKRKRYVVENVPLENFKISKRAKDLDSADLVGDTCMKRRGDLVKEGFSKDVVNKLQKKGRSKESAAGDAARWESYEGGYVNSKDWALEEVEFSNLYPLVDFDGDGIAERRHVIKSGETILKNEWIGIVPYAALTAIMMPFKLIGRSRAEQVQGIQYLQTHLQRQINDNIYQVNRPRVIHTDRINPDDVMTHRTGGRIRAKKGATSLQAEIMPLETPYIGDKALQIVQHIDARRAQTTGSLMASQALDSDSLHKETATRFEGVSDASKAKIELIARCHAETGFRRLYEGMAWLVSHFQDSETEIRVTGETLKVDPMHWKYEHICTSLVGLGSGDEDTILQNMSGIYTVQQAEKEKGSPLVDSKKMYNTLKRMLRAMGISRVSDYINDPEKPEQLLMAQNEIMQALLQQAEAQSQNPLAEAETVKGRIRLAEKQMTEAASFRKFLIEKQIESKQDETELLKWISEYEQKYDQDVPGVGNEDLAQAYAG